MYTFLWFLFLSHSAASQWDVKFLWGKRAATCNRELHDHIRSFWQSKLSGKSSFLEKGHRCIGWDYEGKELSATASGSSAYTINKHKQTRYGKWPQLSPMISFPVGNQHYPLVSLAAGSFFSSVLCNSFISSLWNILSCTSQILGVGKTIIVYFLYCIGHFIGDKCMFTLPSCRITKLFAILLTYSRLLNYFFK